MQKWEELVYAKEEGKAEGLIEGEAKGEAIGEERGKKKQLINLICKKLIKGKTVEVIAGELEEEIGTIARIYEVIKDFAPDYDCDRIYEKICEGE